MNESAKQNTDPLGNVLKYVTVEQYHINTSQSVIVTTEDKLELCLSKHLRRAEQKNKWVAPTGICLTVLITLLTADFKDWGISSDAWTAIFILVEIAALAWLIHSLWTLRKSAKIEEIIKELKATTKTEGDHLNVDK